MIEFLYFNLKEVFMSAPQNVNQPGQAPAPAQAAQPDQMFPLLERNPILPRPVTDTLEDPVENQGCCFAHVCEYICGFFGSIASCCSLLFETVKSWFWTPASDLPLVPPTDAEIRTKLNNLYTIIESWKDALRTDVQKFPCAITATITLNGNAHFVFQEQYQDRQAFNRLVNDLNRLRETMARALYASIDAPGQTEESIFVSLLAVSNTDFGVIETLIYRSIKRAGHWTSTPKQEGIFDSLDALNRQALFLDSLNGGIFHKALIDRSKLIYRANT
jgi:hypothetical protein